MQDNMLSLFDYLGQPAGKELGAQVASYAKIRKVKRIIRHVSNSKYTGYVMVYTKEFLDEYFQAKQIFVENTDHTEINTQLTEDSFNQTDKVF